MRRVLLLLTLAPVFGQSVEGPVFEAASLKKVAEDYIISDLTGGPGTSSPGRTSMHSSVQVLLREAFGLPSYAFVNTNKVPDDKYDFAAVVPEGATKAEFRTMLRNLLVERFHLRYHRETRELSLYELRVAPGGHKLKPTANEPPETNAPSFTRTPDGYLTFPHGVNTPFWGNGPKFSLQRVHTTMDEFAAALEKEWMHAPVVNLTGLTGQYDFYLRFDARRETPANDEPLDPPLEQSLRDQLLSFAEYGDTSGGAGDLVACLRQRTGRRATGSPTPQPWSSCLSLYLANLSRTCVAARQGSARGDRDRLVRSRSVAELDLHASRRSNQPLSGGYRITSGC